jgi:hypothetical protein
MTQPEPQRKRGVILTPEGLKKILDALDKEFPDGYNWEAVSKKTQFGSKSIAAETVSHILNQQPPVDTKSIKILFQAFGLELKDSDYKHPDSRRLSNPQIDWREAPDVSVFYGREKELTTLEQSIVNAPCQLVVLSGMPGIGKTALVRKLAEQIQGNFEYLMWRSLRNALPIQELLADLIKFLANQPQSDLPEDVDERVSRLIEYLRKHRCLLVLDDVETILRSGDRFGRYRQGYEGYGVLLRRVGEAQHQSCLLLCSQEKLREIALLESPTQLVRSLPLVGLEPDDAKKILQEKGLTGEEQWENLIQDYGGNPLALKLVANTIQDLFNGNVASFTKLQTLLINDIFRETLDNQFERLSDLDKEIMCCLASQTNRVSLSELRENMQTSLRMSELIEALEILRGRALIEKTLSEERNTNEPLFTLQPMIKKYVTKYHLLTSKQ